MYLPKHFLIEDSDLLAAFVRSYPLATVIGILNEHSEINHIPLMLSEDGKHLYGHVAKINPLLEIAKQASPEVTAIFHGPQAYITPSWYPSKQETGKVVPTWNYAVAHIQGALRTIEDPVWLRQHVSQMTNLHEPTYQSSWKLEDAPEEYIQTMLNAIIGIEINISSMIGKFKLSQNRPPEDYDGVVANLKRSPDETLKQMLGYMKHA